MAARFLITGEIARSMYFMLGDLSGLVFLVGVWCGLVVGAAVGVAWWLAGGRSVWLLAAGWLLWLLGGCRLLGRLLKTRLIVKSALD